MNKLKNRRSSVAADIRQVGERINEPTVLNTRRMSNVERARRDSKQPFPSIENLLDGTWNRVHRPASPSLFLSEFRTLVSPRRIGSRRPLCPRTYVRINRTMSAAQVEEGRERGATDAQTLFQRLGKVVDKEAAIG